MPDLLCRVTVHCAGVSTDLTLPTGLPVAELIPPIVDILDIPAHGRLRLSPLGLAPLAGPTTLAQNGIRDGAVLVLSSVVPQPPARRCDDDAEVVAATLDTAPPPHRVLGALAAVGLAAVGAPALVRSAFVAPSAWTVVVAGAAAVGALAAAPVAHRGFGDPHAGLALSVVATVLAGVAGLLAVPGVPGAPGVLLAAMTTAVTAVLANRITQCESTVLTVMAGCATIAAAATLTGVLTGAPPHVLGSLTAPACLVLNEAVPRISLLFAGLTPGRAGPEDDVAVRALRADAWVTSLRAAFAVSAAGGAMLAALADRRAVTLCVVTGAVLLMHARIDRRRSLVFAVAGMCPIATTFGVVAIAAPGHGPWIAGATALLVATAIYLGSVAPALSWSPVARRGVDALSCVALTAVMPLACWTCGAFSAARGLSLPS